MLKLKFRTMNSVSLRASSRKHSKLSDGSVVSSARSQTSVRELNIFTLTGYVRAAGLQEILLVARHDRFSFETSLTRFAHNRKTVV